MAGDCKETAWDHVSGDQSAMFFSSEKKYIKRIYDLMAEYPDDVEMVAENQDGSICVRIPIEWLRIRPKKKTNLTPEQKAAAAERLAKYRLQNQADGPECEKGEKPCVSGEEIASGRINAG